MEVSPVLQQVKQAGTLVSGDRLIAVPSPPVARRAGIGGGAGAVDDGRGDVP
jgi:hypothetical protein